jgi:hypothetical protein
VYRNEPYAPPEPAARVTASRRVLKTIPEHPRGRSEPTIDGPPTTASRRVFRSLAERPAASADPAPPQHLPQHLFRLAIMLWALDGRADHVRDALEAVAAEHDRDVQRVASILDLAVEYEPTRAAPKVKWDRDVEYLDLVIQIAGCATAADVGGSAGKVNHYIPQREAEGVQMMAAAQVDLNWKTTLASPDREAAIASLDKELHDLTTRALRPIPADHPEYRDAVRLATRTRAVLGVKRGGTWKSRVVVRGDLQNRERVDGKGFVYYTEASQAAAVRALFFRGRRPPGWLLGTIDITTAFLQSTPFGPGTPARYVVLKHPVTGEQLYYRQTRPVYGEASAPKRWADTLSAYLLSDGFVRGENDSSVYYNRDTKVSLIVHVDDVLFDGPSAGVQQFIRNLGKRFDVKDPDFLTESTPLDFLGMILCRDKHSIYMSAEPYVRQAIEVMGFSDLKIFSTPISGNIDGGEPLGPADARRYMIGVGSLGWMTQARPDLSYVHSRLAQHLAAPTTGSMEGLRRAFGYVAGTPSLCLGQLLTAEPDWTFFTDSDFGGCSEPAVKMRPQIGVVARCGGTPVHYSSKHPKVAFPHPSMTTAVADTGIAGPEIYGAGNGLADFLGLSYVVEELGLPPIDKPMEIQVDNSTVVAFAGRSAKRTKLRHIDTRQWWVRGLRDAGLCNVVHVPTAYNLADFWTKALEPLVFTKFRDQLMVTPPIGTLGKRAVFV